MKVVTVQEMRGIETASAEAGHSYAEMMEQAGRGVAGAIFSRHQVRDKRVLVLIGPGNNGGDGLVAARYLAEAGALVTCYLLKPRDPAEDENLRRILEQAQTVDLITDDSPALRLRQLIRDADIIVDALLGTGARPPLRGRVREILGQIQEVVAARGRMNLQSLASLFPVSDTVEPVSPMIVAVDGPTGMDYDSGALDSSAVPADLTVTFAYPKVGHFAFPAASALGELIIADIGTDPKLAAQVTLEVVTSGMVREWLPDRPLDAHKGTFGRALVIAGSVNYTGAAYLAGAAAARSGVGLVTLALPAIIHAQVAAQLAEATYVLLSHDLGVISADAAVVLGRRMDKYDALLLGPGIGQEPETGAFVKALLQGSTNRRQIGFLGAASRAEATLPHLPPLVVDADGLNLLAQIDDWHLRLPAETIVTPHPGEMARLMGCSIEDIQSHRLNIARSQAAAWGHVVVLKGAYTTVAGPDDQAYIEPFANPGLAKAGTGDVLAGVIVALLAQGMDPLRAAAAGAYLHGLAGELARAEVGPSGMIAGDVLARLPQASRRVTLL